MGVKEFVAQISVFIQIILVSKKVLSSLVNDWLCMKQWRRF